MGIVVIGAVFVDIKGYPLSTYIPGGRNAGRIEQVHGGSYSAVRICSVFRLMS